MIELKNVYKEFKSGSNVNVAVNDTTLTFDKGFTSLLGPSGSGKTTLLNIIGGIENLTTGSLTIDGVTLEGSVDNKNYTDLRRNKIGFIFQHYYLLNYKTVVENLTESLNIIGIFDNSEIKKRITDALNAVDMYRYRNRKVSTLSGGQQQRISIARALIKNSDIILADEPTGNLDSENTFQILSILKTISKDKTVILVTHETEIAKFFSDRVIEISKGKVVSDCLNTDDNSVFDIRNKNNIYLKDLTLKSSNSKNLNLNIYNDGSIDERQLEIMLINHHDGILTDVKTAGSFELVNEYSDIKLLNESYNPVKRSDLGDESLSLSFDDTCKKNKYIPFNKSDLSPTKFSNKNLQLFTSLVVFALYGLFALIILLSLTAVDESFENTYTNRLDAIGFENDEVLSLLDSNEVVSNINSICVKYFIDMDCDYNFHSNAELNESDLYLGQLPSNNYEYVITTGLIASYSRDYISHLGISIVDVININTNFVPTGNNHVIVGVIEDDTSAIYGDFDSFIEVLNLNNVRSNTRPGNIINTKSIENNDKFSNFDVELSSLNDYEVLVNRNLSSTYALNDEITFESSVQPYTVVGYYDHEDDYHFTITTKYSMLSDLLTNYQEYHGRFTYYLISSDDYNGLVNYADDNEIMYYKPTNLYLIAISYINKDKQAEISIALYAFFVAAIMSIVLIYRLGNINYELAVYKSLGAKKRHLVFKYFVKSATTPLLYMVVFSTSLLFIISSFHNAPYIQQSIYDLSFANIITFILIQLSVITVVSLVPAVIKSNTKISTLLSEKN